MRPRKNSGHSVFLSLGKNTAFPSPFLRVPETGQDMSFYPTIVVREPPSFTHVPLAEAAEHGPPLWLTLLPHRCVRRSFTSFHEDDICCQPTDLGTAASRPTYGLEPWQQASAPKAIHADARRSTLLEFFGDHYDTASTGACPASRNRLKGTTRGGVSPFSERHSRCPADPGSSDSVSSLYFPQEAFLGWTGSTAPLSCLAGRSRATDAFLDSVHVEELSIELLGRQDATPPHWTPAPSPLSCPSRQAEDQAQSPGRAQSGLCSRDGESENNLCPGGLVPPCIARRSLRRAFQLFRSTVRSRKHGGIRSGNKSDLGLGRDTKATDHNARQPVGQWDVSRTRESRLRDRSQGRLTGRTLRRVQQTDNTVPNTLNLPEKQKNVATGGRHLDEGHWFTPGATRKTTRGQQREGGNSLPASAGNCSCRSPDADQERLFYIKVGKTGVAKLRDREGRKQRAKLRLALYSGQAMLFVVI